MVIRFLRSRLQFFSDFASHYRQFFGFLSWPKIMVLQVSGLTAAILNTLGFASLFPAIGLVLTDSSTFLEKYIYPHVPAERIPEFVQHHLLATILGAIITIQILKFVSAVTYSGFGGMWTQGHTAEVRRRILDAYQNLAYARAGKNEKSKLLHLNNQLLQLTSYNWGLIETNLKIYNLVFIFALLFLLSAKLMAIAALVTTVIVLALLPFFRWTRTCANKLYFLQHSLLTQVRLFMDGLDTLRTLDYLPNIRQQIHAENEKLVTQNFMMSLSRQSIFSLPELLVFTGIVSILLLLPKGPGQIALFAAFGYTLVRLTLALNDLTTRLNSLLEIKKVPEEVYAYIAHPIRLRPEFQGSHSITKVESISFRNVGIVYNHKQILSNINLDIPVGEISQFIGKNGSGKSTLFRALLKLIPYQGEIRVNGVSLEEISDRALYQTIAYQDQNTFLLPGTISENLLLGNAQVTEAEAIEFCHKLGMNFPNQFADGFHHVVGEDAGNLSGGEIQFICLARTLLRPANVYILDEFTNHLSKPIVQLALDYLKSLQGQKTVLLVNHQQMYDGAAHFMVRDGTVQNPQKKSIEQSAVG